jgi:ribosome-associated toxin RatA of RatAB toxin-antitoxin module
MLSPSPCGQTLMHQTNAIVMQAPLEKIFETAANLERWPTFLPHYRYIRYLERGPARNIVKMAARRGRIPVSWISEQTVDHQNLQVRFLHLKAWTKGMRVVWHFKPLETGVEVRIVHDLSFRLPLLAPLAEPIIGGFFIGYVATQTLTHMKVYLEKQ